MEQAEGASGAAPGKGEETLSLLKRSLLSVSHTAPTEKWSSLQTGRKQGPASPAAKLALFAKKRDAFAGKLQGIMSLCPWMNPGRTCTGRLSRLIGTDFQHVFGDNRIATCCARWFSDRGTGVPERSKPPSGTKDVAGDATPSPSSTPANSLSGSLDEFAVSRFGRQQWTPGLRGMRPSTNARPWKAAELRLKSTDDLHRLWFVMVKEKLALLSERDFCRRNSLPWKGSSDLWKLRKGMARLKTVVGERFRQKRAVQRETESAS